MSLEIQEDLIVIELLKLARVLKRQIKLISNNLDKIRIEDIEKIKSILIILESDFNKLKSSNSEGLDDIRK